MLRGRLWLPIITLEGVPPARVGELQATATGDPNASLGANGRLTGPDD